MGKNAPFFSDDEAVQLDDVGGAEPVGGAEALGNFRAQLRRVGLEVFKSSLQMIHLLCIAVFLS